MTSIVDHLERGAAAHPERALYSFLDARGRVKDAYTYAAFEERTRHLALHLAQEGRLRRGDRVLLVYPPGLELIAAFFACVRIGVIPVPVSLLSKLALIARDCTASAALTTREGMRRGPTLPGVPWITTDEVRGRATNGFRNDPDPVLFLQYTSGSTSDPKASSSRTPTWSQTLPPCSTSCRRWCPWLPQHHDMGLIGYYLYPVITGGTAFGFSPLDFLKRPALWLETISRFGASHTASPNFGYEYCLREDKLPEAALAGIDLGSLRVMMNAAEPVRPETQERFLSDSRPAACGRRRSSPRTDWRRARSRSRSMDGAR
jgi:acyl-CoA synthetase (AMP-forming)/AMP-acid ligase II